MHEALARAPVLASSPADCPLGRPHWTRRDPVRNGSAGGATVAAGTRKRTAQGTKRPGAHRDLAGISRGTGILRSRWEHLYPDGVARLFASTTSRNRRPGVAKPRASEASATGIRTASRGSGPRRPIVGSDCLCWYGRCARDDHAELLRGAKDSLTLGGIRNPGVLFDWNTAQQPLKRRPATVD